MTDHQSNLQGKRYINWVRCSTKGQADTSLEDQLQVLTAFADRNGMTYVADVILDGISGLNPKVQEIAAMLVERKNLHDDFDIVLVHDFSRLTRGGSLSGSKIEYEFLLAGIELVSVMDDVPEGEFADLFKTLKHTAANQQSKAIALATTRGSMSAILAGKGPHCHNAPYGTDRLIVSAADQPLFLLHLLSDGRQQKLDCHTRAVLDTFGRNAKNGSPNHYRKQKDERVELVPGDPDESAVVNLIYELKHRRGWGEHLIAKYLNDQGIPSPRGNQWSSNAAIKILNNPLYLGKGVTNQTTTGRHFMRSVDGPVPAKRSFQELAKYKQPPRRRRAEKEWQWIEQPAMRNFLAEEFRPLAEAAQRGYWDRVFSRSIQNPQRRDRHHESPYILKGRLTCAKTGLKLRGHSSKNWRYYQVSGAHGKPSSKASIPRQLVPADPINQLVLQQLAIVIRSVPTLRQSLSRQIEQRQATLAAADVDLAELEQERQRIDEKLGFIVDDLPSLGREVAGAKTKELSDRRAQIEAKLRNVAANKLSPKEIESRIDAIVGAMGQSVDWIRQMGRPALERLLDHLLAKAVVDVRTRHVELEFRLPSWAISSPKSLCLPSTHDSMSWRETKSDNGLLLMRCRVFWLGGTYLGYRRAG